jgi:hypothetical protein
MVFLFRALEELLALKSFPSADAVNTTTCGKKKSDHSCAGVATAIRSPNCNGG